MLVPLQIGDGVEAVTFGFGFTVMATVVLFVQPFASVPVIVYVDVIVGFAVTDDPDDALSLAIGVQV